MKICFIHPSDPTKDNDSITNYIKGILDFSYSGKHDINYIGISKNGKSKNKTSDKYQFYSLGKLIKRKLFIPPTLVYLILLYKFIIRNKNRYRERILSFHQIDSAFPFLYPIKLGYGIVTIHGFHGASASLKRRENFTFFGKCKIFIFNLLEELVIRKIDKIIVVSRERYAYYLSKYPNKKNKIVFIPPYVDHQKFFFRNDRKSLRKKYGYSEEDIILLYIGRIVKEKNIYLMVKCAEKINIGTDRLNIKLILVGDGDDKVRIKGIIKSENIKNVFLYSEMSHSHIPEILNCANVCLLVSSFEGTPMSILEALSCGIPVIASRVGDCPKLISNKKNGYLLNNISEKEIINAIKSIIKNALNPEICIQSVRKYQSTNILPILLKEYSKTFSEINKLTDEVGFRKNSEKIGVEKNSYEKTYDQCKK